MSLSPTARCLLGGFFLMPRSTLTIGGEETRLSNQAREAMTELLMADLVERRCTDDRRAAAISYNLTEKGKQFDRKVSPEYMEKHGRFPLTAVNKE